MARISRAHSGNFYIYLTEKEIEMVGGLDVYFDHLTFDPDGETVYFLRSSDQEPGMKGRRAKSAGARAKLILNGYIAQNADYPGYLTFQGINKKPNLPEPFLAVDAEIVSDGDRAFMFLLPKDRVVRDDGDARSIETEGSSAIFDRVKNVLTEQARKLPPVRATPPLPSITKAPPATPKAPPAASARGAIPAPATRRVAPKPDALVSFDGLSQSEVLEKLRRAKNLVNHLVDKVPGARLKIGIDGKLEVGLLQNL